MVFLLPAWANRPKEYKKGGKVKKDKKPKAKQATMSQNVKVNVKIGDSVLLHKGKAPKRSNPGVAKRFLSPGSAFGGGLPRPLQSMAYASAPPVAMPMGRMDFIGSGEVPYNRGRDRRDDIPINVNPSNIRPDVSPSIRAVSSSSAVETPDRGLAIARMLQKGYDSLGASSQRIYDNLSFQGEVPRIGGANLKPSSRVVASQPSTGYANMNKPFGSLSEMSKAQADLGDLPGGEQEFMRREADTMRAMGINPETGSALPSPRNEKSASASARGMRRGGTVF
jgi:hypothetical protein